MVRLAFVRLSTHPHFTRPLLAVAIDPLEPLPPKIMAGRAAPHTHGPRILADTP
ncbi:MAG: hypothetical protein FJZ00_13080 [Candidatus Sericytochromatia bacterium]|uniref:Uncharacterized protein n=1 Tax=Candidatus Tanganyikabacteria bacterium TaxID=2961651 RepID=A0A938BPF5_9BACT|nr:hypothetical protein [Candidatus Tanganyikabacteria bacterium]